MLAYSCFVRTPHLPRGGRSVDVEEPPRRRGERHGVPARRLVAGEAPPARPGRARQARRFFFVAQSATAIEHLVVSKAGYSVPWLSLGLHPENSLNNFLSNFEFGAVQKCVSLVGLEKN